MIDPALWTRLATAELRLDAALRDAFGWSGAQIDQVLPEYRRFLYLLALQVGPLRAPGVVLDAVWGAHRAQGAQYQRFCRDHFGRMLAPGDSHATPPHAAWRHAYLQEFGSAAPPLFWPDQDPPRSGIPAVLLALAGMVATGLSGSVWPAILGFGFALFLLPRAPKRQRAHTIDDDWNLAFLMGSTAFWSTARHPEATDDVASDAPCFDEMSLDEHLDDNFDGDRG